MNFSNCSDTVEFEVFDENDSVFQENDYENYEATQQDKSKFMALYLQKLSCDQTYLT